MLYGMRERKLASVRRLAIKKKKERKSNCLRGGFPIPHPPQAPHFHRIVHELPARRFPYRGSSLVILPVRVSPPETQNADRVRLIQEDSHFWGKISKLLSLEI